MAGCTMEMIRQRHSSAYSDAQCGPEASVSGPWPGQRTTAPRGSWAEAALNQRWMRHHDH